MAISPAHRFGQIIGEVLEAATLPLLESFAKTHDLYLDKKGNRPCRKGQKCSWKDLNGNSHDLDYVLERGGGPDKVGMPAAFIETAWRRYTKHSRNKAREIQGAIVPLSTTFRNSRPFMGAILAGEFTAGALAQLKSLGFTVLYFSYETVVSVFRQHGIDAAFDEQTPDGDFQKQVGAYQRMTVFKRRTLARNLLKAQQKDVDHFIKSLSISVSRQIERIFILPLHGSSQELSTIDDAVKFVQDYRDRDGGGPLHRYEITIRYNNGDRIEASFQDKETAIQHLRIYQPILITPR